MCVYACWIFTLWVKAKSVCRLYYHHLSPSTDIRFVCTRTVRCYFLCVLLSLHFTDRVLILECISQNLYDLSIIILSRLAIVTLAPMLGSQLKSTNLCAVWMCIVLALSYHNIWQKGKQMRRRKNNKNKTELKKKEKKSKTSLDINGHANER